MNQAAHMLFSMKNWNFLLLPLNPTVFGTDMIQEYLFKANLFWKKRSSSFYRIKMLNSLEKNALLFKFNTPRGFAATTLLGLVDQ